MFANFGGWHLLAILFIILLLFGAPKLPGLAKSLGQSMRILKKEVGTDREAGAEATEPSTDDRRDDLLREDRLRDDRLREDRLRDDRLRDDRLGDDRLGDGRPPAV